MAAFVWRLPAALVILAVPLGLRPVAMVRAGATGRELIGVLGATGQLQLGLRHALHARAGARRLTRRVTRPSRAVGYHLRLHLPADPWGTSMSLPPPPAAPPPPPGFDYGAGAPATTAGKAIGALVCGIVGLLLCGVVLGLVAI